MKRSLRSSPELPSFFYIYAALCLSSPVYVLLTDLCPKNASYYGNRAATLMMLSRYREALEDSQQAVRLDNSFMKVRPQAFDQACKKAHSF